MGKKKNIGWSLPFLYVVLVGTLLTGAAILAYVQFIRYRVYATNERVYTVSVISPDPFILLTERASCSGKYQGSCINEQFIFLLTLAFIELTIVLIIRILRGGKKFHIIFFIFHQGFWLPLVSVWILMPWFAYRSLSSEARVEVRQALSLLATDRGRKSAGIIPSVAEYPRPFTVVIDKSGYEAVFRILRLDVNEKNTFYRARILPDSLLTVGVDKQTLYHAIPYILFSTGNLFIENEGTGTVQSVVPSIAENELTSASFSGMNMKKPNVNFLEDSLYIAKQKKKEQDMFAELGAQEIKIIDQKSEYTATLSTIASQLLDTDRNYADYAAYGKQWFSDCQKSMGVSDQFCTDGEKKIEDNLAGLTKNKQELVTDQSRIISYQPQLDDALRKIRSVRQEMETDPVVPEYQNGVFYEPDEIYIRLSPGIPFFQYINSAIHEYMHFTSAKQDKILPKFFEEGMADYLAKDLTDKVKGTPVIPTDTSAYHVGYTELVAVIGLLYRSIPGNVLTGIFYSKNESDLEKAINDVYGKEVYQKLRVLGDQIYYSKGSDFSAKAQIFREIQSLLNVQK